MQNVPNFGGANNNYGAMNQQHGGLGGGGGPGNPVILVSNLNEEVCVTLVAYCRVPPPVFELIAKLYRIVCWFMNKERIINYETSNGQHREMV